jgi:hypothetical protein
MLCVGSARYNAAVSDFRRDDFPNDFVGDLMHTERGWVVGRRGAARTAAPTATVRRHLDLFFLVKSVFLDGWTLFGSPGIFG